MPYNRSNNKYLYKPWHAKYNDWVLPYDRPECTFDPGKNRRQERRNENRHWTAMQLMARQSMIGMMLGY